MLYDSRAGTKSALKESQKGDLPGQTYADGGQSMAYEVASMPSTLTMVANFTTSTVTQTCNPRMPRKGDYITSERTPPPDLEPSYHLQRIHFLASIPSD